MPRLRSGRVQLAAARVLLRRGGSRSGALTHVLQQVGWRAARLDGGYKTYRRAVIDDLEVLPRRYQCRVV